MRVQTILIIAGIVAIIVFLARRARQSGGYSRRFDSPVPPQNSSPAYVPLYIDSGAAGSSHHSHGVDCGHSASDAGGGCSDGGAGGGDGGGS
jgi:hypothetical protein